MGSSAFLLPLEPRGLYREMLTQAWRRQARLPNNHQAIQRAVGCTADEWSRCWPAIQHYWRVDGAFLVNETQLEIYQETTDLSAKRSEAGRLGNQKRWSQENRKTVASDIANDIANTSPPSPSPSPSLISVSISDSEKKRTIAPTALLSADADFEAFRQAYPVSRRVGGKQALKAWKSATKGRNGAHLETMLGALEQHKRSEQWQTAKLIPLMTTWLNQERWTQVLPAAPRPIHQGWNCPHDELCRDTQACIAKMSTERKAAQR